MSSLEQLMEEIIGAGYLINNLFQSQDSRAVGEREWQANLRSIPPDHSFFEFGHGATAYAALKAAWDKTRNPTIKKNNMPAFLPKAHVSVQETPASLEDML